MFAIFKRELKGLFQSFTGYVFCAFVLLFEGIYVISFNLKQNYANFEYTLSYLSFILIIGIPFVTMKTFAEERKQKTDKLLYSLPVSMVDVVLGKFLSLICLVAIPCLIMTVYPLVLRRFGNVNLKIAYSTLCGFFFLSSTLLSIGMLISSFCENQGTAAGLSFVVFLLLYYGEDLSNYITASVKGVLVVFGLIMLIVGCLVYLATKKKYISAGVAVGGELVCVLFSVINRAKFSQALVVVIKKAAIFSRFFSFIDGIFDIPAIVYFASITAVALVLNAAVLENRRVFG